jgi:defect in organelle trafficking protein DotC
MIMTKKIKIMAIASLLTLGLASTAAFADSDTTNINANVGYVNTSQLPDGNGSINPIRLKAIEDTATTLGARGALAWRSLQIDHSLSISGNHLDHVFDFNQLLISGNVLPPVITQSDDTLTQNDDNTLRLASKSYDIVSPASFVTAPPTWRSYLWMDYAKPSLPNRTLFPTTKDEATVWNAYLKQGWGKGLDQANEIFRENLDRLKRDYAGMILYKQLLAQHMVSKPFVAKADLGVTGDANHIRINDQVLRITAASQLQTNSAKWSPVITP